jgi:hypothetical protein
VPDKGPPLDDDAWTALVGLAIDSGFLDLYTHAYYARSSMPKEDSASKKSQRMQLRLDKEEQRMVRELAKRDGLTSSQVVRMLVRKAYEGTRRKTK